MKNALCFLLVLFSMLFPLRSQTYSDTDIISVEKNQDFIEKLQKMKLDLLLEWSNRLYFLCGLNDLYRLQKEEIPYVIETENFHPYRQGDITMQAGINGAYHSYLEIEADLMALEAAYPQVAKVITIGSSLEGRNIYALKISDNVDLDEAEAEVFFVGCHHAREWISVEVPYLLAKYLVENYESDPEIKTLVNRSEVWIIPLLNPDGLEYSIHFYRYWRKNRRDNGGGSYGVDLNRNYGYNWGFDNEGSSSNPFSNTYRGAAAFSEPETQAVRDFFQQRRIQALITYHSHGQVILYPWGYTGNPALKDELLEEIAAEMSGRIEAVNGNIYEYGQAGEALYLTNGDTTDWTFGTYGIPSYTFELPPVDALQGGFFNAEYDISSIFEENLPAALYLIEWSILNFKCDCW